MYNTVVHFLFEFIHNSGDWLNFINYKAKNYFPEGVG